MNTKNEYAWRRMGPLVLLLAQAWTPELVAQSTVPLDVRMTVPPMRVSASDGTHLLYELLAMNQRGAPTELVSLEVLADDGRVLQRSDAATLEGDIARPGLANDDAGPRVVGGGSFALVMMEVVLTEEVGSIRHRLTVRRGDGELRELTTDPVAVPSGLQGVPVLASPLRGDGWVAANGLSNDSDHRRASITIDGSSRIAQRFAIDWARFGGDGRLTSGDPSVNSNWAGYGAEVLAVGDGVIVSVQDDIPENTPLTGEMAVPITLETIAGNHVVLELDGGLFALYGHLVPGSLRVQAGQRVRSGEVLGLLGNSGNSDAPHLHFHVMDRPSPLGSEGVPFVFDRFTLRSVEASIDPYLGGRPWTAPAGRERSVRRSEMPLAGAVVEFDPR